MKPGGEFRLRLRAATAQIHERLHGHAGLGAAASGQIGRADYRLLLARLWGFHKAFEGSLEDPVCALGLDIDMQARARAPMLEEDLATLGYGPAQIARLPRCGSLLRPRNAPECLGALYVVEGSTLGGVHIARALSSLFDGEGGEGRKFFLGYGAAHGAMWRGFLHQLDVLSGDQAREAQAIEGAVRTFVDFEGWMNGWGEAPAAGPGTQPSAH